MKIYTKADKLKRETGCGYILRAAGHGATCAEFHALNYDEYDEICAKAARIKGTRFEAFHYSLVVRLWTVEDWAHWNACEDEKKRLVDGFWETLHNLGREAAGKYYTDHAADYVRLGIA